MLAGRRVLITGAGRGIGRAYAFAMAAEGAQVVVNDLGVDLAGRGSDDAPAVAVAEKIRAAGGTAIASEADVADFEQAGALIQCAVAEFGGVDALVNNAAIEFRGEVVDHGPADWDRVMSVNARGSFNCARWVAPVMRDQGHGTIVNTTSGAFWEGTEGVAAYAASKAAVFSLTLTLHTELSPMGITANAIAPNATRTRMVDAWIEQLVASGRGSEDEVAAEYGIQEPGNLTALAITLCSGALPGVSGRVFEVWGDRIHMVEPPTRGPGLERGGAEWSVSTLLEQLPKLAR